jgi:uncharacterized membrane protein YjjB (DUF3815 family)
MAAGVAIGAKVGNAAFPGVVMGATIPAPSWVFWPSVAALGASFVGVLQAPLREAYMPIGASLLACALTILADPHTGGTGAAAVAAFGVSFAGHLYQRFTGKPAMLVQVPGLLTLVPGSVGFRGLNALIEQNFLEGIRITTDMVLTATAIAVGTLLANGLVPMLFPRRSGVQTAGDTPGII